MMGFVTAAIGVQENKRVDLNTCQRRRQLGLARTNSQAAVYIISPPG
ncbi:MAG: hypothetical protein ACJATW_002181 [Glaciecola sp.]|jgi:hypothetical protein